ncbi:hypothetical protein ACJIZ3_018043 [Penstemon smallii]|uniref:CRIB domain-containing protein n=1 Tax=Penstemon smallii TaxID=265156 RepID=A0ABD3SY30_9LAMI
MMRDGNFGRFVIFSFPIGCDSESSVALATATTTTTTTTHSSKNKHYSKSSEAKSKKNRGLSKASGLHKLINRLLKSFSHLFLYKEEMEMEHNINENEMEIGFPTDVKHVTHIGLDGSTRGINSPFKSTQNNNNPEFLSISLEQFELAMNAQSHAPLPIRNSTNDSNQVQTQSL